jgi:hypothetical protein
MRNSGANAERKLEKKYDLQFFYYFVGKPNKL